MIFLKAFIVGGLICLVGQILIDNTKLTPARILVLFVCLGVLLGAFGVYDKLVDFAGAGTKRWSRWSNPARWMAQSPCTSRSRLAFPPSAGP